jgi:hypothetical protein
VQLGQGNLTALATLVGILLGTAAYEPLNARVLRWDVHACGES